MSKKPITILQCLPSLHSGGVERGTIEVARAIKDAGMKPLVASSGGPMIRLLDQQNIPHIQLPLNKKNPLAIWKNSKALDRIVAEHKVDVLHARSRAPAWSAYHSAKRTGCHFMTTFHGTYSISGEWKRRYNSVMTRGERVIAISEFIERHIRENYAVEADRLKVIPRGVDINQFDPTKMDEKRMMRLLHYSDIPNDVPMLLFPARLTRWKGHLFLLEALKRLSHRNFFCLIIGDDKDHSGYREELERTIRDYGLVGHVKIEPHSQDIPAAYFMSALVLCLSLRQEAFGRVPVEAQAMGRPVIATNQGGFWKRFCRANRLAGATE